MSTGSLEQWEKGYLAGVLDSDGALIIRRIQKSYSFNCYLQFVGTLEQMVKVRDMMGCNNKKIYEHGNRYSLMLMKQEDVVSILKRIYPYLTKKPEADLVFRMRSLHDRSNSFGRKGNKPSKETLNQRLAIFRTYKSYKSRSGGHTTNWDELEESLNEAYNKVSHDNPEPSPQELINKLSLEDRGKVIKRLREGVETSSEIMNSSVPLEREEIVRA